MADSIGEKVKKLRKEMHMTQTELAGNEMTKSMLSQIENNLAMPSMKNLQYIADRLKRPVSYFLDDYGRKNGEEAAIPVDEINAYLKDIDKIEEIDREGTKKVLEILEGMLGEYKFNKKSKVYADIISRTGYCLIRLSRFDEGEVKIKEAVDIYIENRLFIDAAKANMKLMHIPWQKYDYEGSLEIMKRTEDIYKDSISRDMFLEIEMLHTKAALSSAFGDLDEAFSYIDEAINLSKETNIHYNSDELYRMKAAICLTIDRYNDYEYNIKKAEQFAEFTENKKSLTLILIVKIVYENRVHHPEKALEMLEMFKKQAVREIMFYYYTEKARALYALGDYEHALECIAQVDLESNEPNACHKFDYLNLWENKVYEGLILNKLGRADDSIKAINAAIKKMEAFSESKPLVFAYKSLSEVYSGLGDFENAYKYLKRSNEIQDYLVKHNKSWY